MSKCNPLEEVKSLITFFSALTPEWSLIEPSCLNHIHIQDYSSYFIRGRKLPLGSSTEELLLEAPSEIICIRRMTPIFFKYIDLTWSRHTIPWFTVYVIKQSNAL